MVISINSWYCSRASQKSFSMPHTSLTYFFSKTTWGSIAIIINVVVIHLLSWAKGRGCCLRNLHMITARNKALVFCLLQWAGWRKKDLEDNFSRVGTARRLVSGWSESCCRWQAHGPRTGWVTFCWSLSLCLLLLLIFHLKLCSALLFSPLIINPHLTDTCQVVLGVALLYLLLLYRSVPWGRRVWLQALSACQCEKGIWMIAASGEPFILCCLAFPLCS